MKKFFKWVVIVIALLIAIFVVGGIFLPSKWSVTESATISAPAHNVYEQIANLHNWQVWSPWTKEKDPTQVYTYEGPEMGVGAKWLWTSEKMGKGWLEIKEADLDKGIAYILFIDMNGTQSTILGKIAYSSEDGALNVVWTDEGDSGNSLVKRWMALVIKYMLAKEMNSGLNQLKALVEKH